jgi:tetratricopeptide (TPR) repeat protein
MTIWGRKETTSDPDPGLAEGLRLYDDGEYAGSIKYLAKKARTGDAFACFKLANALSEIGQPRAAMAYWELAISLGNNASLNNLGNRYKDLGYKQKAYELYVRGAEGGSDDAMHSAGVLAQDMGLDEQSRHWLEKGIEARNPRCAGVLGQMLHQLGKTEEAIEVLEKGMESKSLSSHLVRAIIYKDMGDLPAARTTLANAPRLGTVDPRENHLLPQVKKLISIYSSSDEEDS